MNETIGQVIRRLRKERDWTQAVLAEQLGVTSQAISKWIMQNHLSRRDYAKATAIAEEMPSELMFLRGMCRPYTSQRKIRRHSASRQWRISVNCWTSSSHKSAVSASITTIKKHTPMLSCAENCCAGWFGSSKENE